jgi:hypothetical protein
MYIGGTAASRSDNMDAAGFYQNDRMIRKQAWKNNQGLKEQSSILT